MSTQNPSELSETELLFAMIMARLEVIESTLMVALKDHPDRASIESSVRLIAEARTANGLHATTSELGLQISLDARRDSLAAIFPEPAPMSGSVQPHTL